MPNTPSIRKLSAKHPFKTIPNMKKNRPYPGIILDLDLIRGPLKGTPGYEKWYRNFLTTMQKKNPNYGRGEIAEKEPIYSEKWLSRYRDTLERKGITKDQVFNALQGAHDTANAWAKKLGNLEKQQLREKSPILRKRIDNLHQKAESYITRMRALAEAYPELNKKVVHKTPVPKQRPPDVIPLKP